MKTTVTDISTTEIVERLNSYALANRDADDYLTRLYMEDGHHYEDDYDRIINILEKEAKRRGLISKSATELVTGEIIKTAWSGEMIVEEPRSEFFGSDILLRGDVLLYRRRDRLRHPFYFTASEPATSDVE